MRGVKGGQLGVAFVGTVGATEESVLDFFLGAILDQLE
jgi:hypothetical protein